ncbi:interleukin-4 precursor [Camelus ferus]|nr:interleukin-4 precursor [Camelus ferus]
MLSGRQAPSLGSPEPCENTYSDAQKSVEAATQESSYHDNFAHGHKCDITLQEIIKTLNTLTARKNTTEKETFCKAATALRHIYRHHNCLSKHLSGLDRNLSGLANTEGTHAESLSAVQAATQKAQDDNGQV